MSHLRRFLLPFDLLLNPLVSAPSAESTASDEEKRALELTNDEIILATVAHLDARQSDLNTRALGAVAPLLGPIGAGVVLLREGVGRDLSLRHEIPASIFGFLALYALFLAIVYLLVALVEIGEPNSRWLLASETERSDAVARRLDDLYWRTGLVNFIVGMT